MPLRGKGNSPQSVNLTPVIISCGPDGNLGLICDPNSGVYPGNPLAHNATPSFANDNIYSTYSN